MDYCGNFMNDKRHGWGTTYDRNGNKLFEGDWRCGKNDFEDDRIVIEDRYFIDNYKEEEEEEEEKEEVNLIINCENDMFKVHNMINELVICAKSFNRWVGNLVIENYPNLEKITVKKKSLMNLNSLKICSCEKLKTIKTEDSDYEKGAFYNVKNVIIESIWIFDFCIYIFLIYNHS